MGVLKPAAKSLILDLLSTLRRGTMPVGALVEAGALLGIEENNIRVSLARLYASDRVERDERGRYRLGSAVAAMSDRLRGWRDLNLRQRATSPWRGDWIAVHCAKLGRGPARRRREHALSLLGFRELEASFSLRPDNLRGGLEGVREQLTSLATGAQQTDCALGRVFIVRDLDPESDRAARALWDAESLIDEGHESCEALNASIARLPKLSDAEAMVETFLVGGRVLRQLIRHPLLPGEILDPAPLAELLSTMKVYDRIGRDHWAGFLARHDVPHRALPLNSGPSDEHLAAGFHEPSLTRSRALLSLPLSPFVSRTGARK
jgi:phenylacetic acid degradation operon negative regulatory protein